MNWNEERQEEIWLDEDELETLEKERKAVMTQPKEKRLEFYFRCGCAFYLDELELTEEDVREYQKRKEAEVSMKPEQKQDAVVKQVVIPLLRDKGFQTSGTSWWKELEDCWLFLYMKNSSCNGAGTGVTFCFEISVSGKDEIKDKLSEQWMYNQFDCLCQNDFLPYQGYLTPRVEALGYRIDGYRNYLPLDEPLEEIMERIRGHFENYIFPALDRIRTKADWDLLYKEKKVAKDTEDIRLLRYYSSAHMLSCAESNIPLLMGFQKNFGLTSEQILSHFDWLEIIIQKSDRTFDDTKSFILKALDMQRNGEV